MIKFHLLRLVCVSELALYINSVTMNGTNRPALSNEAGSDVAAAREQGETTHSQRTPTIMLSVASLRRASPLHTPTRTLRLDEGEHISRQRDQTGPLATRVTLASLASRPRSNPRSRTPMRYESPLNPDEFRRESQSSAAAGNDDEPSTSNSNRESGRTITIRPTAGLAVGTTLSSNRHNRTIHEERPKSRKQGPSHRKVRRWNNDHFVGLASEIAKLSNGRGHIAAEVLMRAHEDAPLYRSLYDPAEHRSEKISR